jgi:hypothetical protein
MIENTDLAPDLIPARSSIKLELFPQDIPAKSTKNRAVSDYSLVALVLLTYTEAIKNITPNMQYCRK